MWQGSLQVLTSGKLFFFLLPPRSSGTLGLQLTESSHQLQVLLELVVLAGEAGAAWSCVLLS